MTDLLPPPTAERHVFEEGAWTIRFDGRVFHESDATGEHLAFLSLLNGPDSWAPLDLSDLREASPVVGPGRLMSWIVAFIAVADGLDDETLLAKVIQDVRSRKAVDLVSCIEFH